MPGPAPCVHAARIPAASDGRHPAFLLRIALMRRAYLAISIVTVLWAGNFTVAKFATREFHPVFIAAVRVLLTGAIFYFFLPREQRKLAKGDWKTLIPISLSGIALNHMCFALGIARTTPSHSAIIHALLPVTVALTAWIVAREKQGQSAIHRANIDRLPEAVQHQYVSVMCHNRHGESPQLSFTQ